MRKHPVPVKLTAYRQPLLSFGRCKVFAQDTHLCEGVRIVSPYPSHLAGSFEARYQSVSCLVILINTFVYSTIFHTPPEYLWVKSEKYIMRKYKTKVHQENRKLEKNLLVCIKDIFYCFCRRTAAPKVYWGSAVGRKVKQQSMGAQPHWFRNLRNAFHKVQNTTAAPDFRWISLNFTGFGFLNF